MDFYIPQQLAEILNNTIAENCGSQAAGDGNCESSIASAITPGSQNLQARAPLGPVVLVISALMGLISIALASNRFSSSNGEMVGHVPGIDLDQISTVQVASTVAYVTTDVAATPISVTSTIVAQPSLR